MTNHPSDRTDGLAIALVGPTCVGKTAYVRRLLAHYPFEVINLDSFQIYEHFFVGTGRADAQFGSRGHLYGVVSPDQALSPEEYATIAAKLAGEIRSRGSIPLFEGGSISYLRALCSQLVPRLIGLAPPDDRWLRAAIERRIDSYDQATLFDEIRIAQQRGRGLDVVLKDDVVYLPAVEYLQGRISVGEARARVVENLVRRAHTQMESYRMFDITWIPSDQPDSTDRLVDAVEHVISEHVARRSDEGAGT